MIIRAVRALAWLQWRLLVNTLRGGRRRDAIERTSRWLDAATPVVVAVLAVPALLVLVVLAALAGFSLVRSPDNAAVVVAVVSFVLLAPLVIVVFRPLAGADRGYLERSDLIRLLPIPRALLFNLEFARAAADPVVLFFVPGAAAVVLGALAAGGGGLALVALGGGIAFLLVLVCFAGLATVAAQLFLRDRRRAEGAALLVALTFMALSLLPQFLARDRRRESPRRAPVVAQPPGAARGEGARPFEGMRVPASLRVLPSSLYGTALGQAASGQWLGAAGGIGVITLLAAVGYGAAAPLQRRLLETPARSSRGAHKARESAWTLPFVSAGTAAVAAVQARTILRTVRGRWGLIASPLVGMMFVLVFSPAPGPHTPDVWGSPTVIAVLVIFLAIQSLAALSANQFAADGPGLAMVFLQPVAAGALVRGKAIGIGLLHVVCMLLASLPLVLLLRPPQPALVGEVFLGGLAAVVVLAPVNAALSALLPKRVDLSRWGRPSNPHRTAALLSFLAGALAAGPLVGAQILASGVLRRPGLALVLIGSWLAIAVLIASVAFPVAERILVKRRESLLFVALGG